jgi:hypothetical protein
MAISSFDIQKSVELLRAMGATRVWLFGSSLDNPEAARDLDLACEGIPPERFYRAVGRLLAAVNKPVDLVDVGKSTRLNDYIRRTGRLVYDAERVA